MKFVTNILISFIEMCSITQDTILIPMNIHEFRYYIVTNNDKFIKLTTPIVFTSSLHKLTSL